MSDLDRTVTAVIKSVRQKSIFIDAPRRTGDVAIPRSLIHGGDDHKLDALQPGREGISYTFRLLEWKAEEVGLS